MNITDVLNPDSPVSPISLTASTSTQLIGVDAGQASPGIGESMTQEHNGVTLSADSANTTPVYVLCGTGSASATNWHFVLPAGITLDASIGGAVWRGPLQAWSSAVAKVGVAVA